MPSSGARCPASVSTSSLPAPRNRFRRWPSARSPPAPGNAATPTGATAGRTSSGCAPPAHAIPHLDETRWQATEPAIGRGGEVSLRGLPPLVVAELLVGLQQRCRINAVKTNDAVLRALCNDVRRRQVDSLTDYVPGDDRDLEFTGLVNCLIGHARRALSTPETEVTQDEWDLTVFGHNGTVSFTGITQTWLREAAKRWAADDLPKRRVRPGRRTSAGLAVRHHIGCLARLSESLRMREDRGEHPAMLGRADMEAFLHRLAYLESVGQISGDARIRACREVRAVLTGIRAMGLTRPGGLAAGLGEDFAIGRADVPAEPEPGEPNRDLPPEIMRPAVRTPGSTDLTGDAHRRRAGHRHRSPPRRDLRPGLRLPDPRRRRTCPC